MKDAPPIRYGLRFYILLPLSLFLILSIAAFVYGFLLEEENRTNEDLQWLHHLSQQLHQVTLENESNNLAVSLGLIKDNPALQRSFISRDRTALLKLATPIFEQLRSTSQITHFYFHDRDRVNFLRAHQPDRFGDIIDRITLRNAQVSHQRQSGIELGPLGTFTLRVVIPWYQGDQLIGYLELGEEIGHLFDNASKITETNLVVTINKQFLSREGWKEGEPLRVRSSGWSDLPRSVIAYQSMGSLPDDLFSNIQAEMGGALEIENKYYQLISLPLRDATKQEIGRIFHFYDVTPQLDRSKRSATIIVFITIILGAIVFALFYVLTGRAEKQLKASYLKNSDAIRLRETLQATHVAELEHEIAARQHAESILSDSHASLEHLLTSSPAVIYTCNIGGSYAPSFVSDNVNDMLGYSSQEFVADPDFWIDHVHPDDKDRVLANLADLSAQEQCNHEYRFMAKDGHYHWMRDGLRLLRDPNENPEEIVGYWVDITEFKNLALDWESVQQRLTLHFEQTPMGVIEWKPDFEIVAWNPAAENIFGFKKEEVIGKKPFGLIVSNDDKEIINTVWQDLLSKKGGTRSSNMNVTKDGRKIFCEWYNTVLLDDDGHNVGVVSLVEDITERKKIQEDNLRADRALHTLNECSSALVRAQNIESLQNDVCRILVDSDRYLLAWIGYIEDSTEKIIRVVSKAGLHSDYLDEITVRWDDSDFGQGPVGKAIREKRTQVIHQIASSSTFSPWREAAIRRGYQSCVTVPLINQEHAFGVIAVYADEPDAFSSQEVAVLEDLARDLSYGIRALRYRTERNNATQALTTSLLETVEAVARTVEKRDPYTAGHQHRVALLAVAIARKMGLNEEKIEGIRLGATIHDIGKIYIPAEILNRPGRLTEHEFGMIKTHCQVGYDIMESVYFPWPVKEMILQHHERMNGTGYPQGLKADEIILEARIITVADTVEAITAHRPYRASLGIKKALSVIKNEAGIGLDKKVVKACVTLFETDGFEWDTSDDQFIQSTNNQLEQAD